MISQRARHSVEHIFMKSAKSTLIVGQDDFCRIEPVFQNGHREFPGNKIFILTISSFLFRLVMIFHVNEAQSTRDYFVKDSSNVSFSESFSESVNLCAGAMNRELLQHFPHLGMSTPYTLDSNCLPYLSELQPAHTSRYAISINDVVNLHATLCLCAYKPFDFVTDMTAKVEETGELEMF